MATRGELDSPFIAVKETSPNPHRIIVGINSPKVSFEKYCSKHNAI